MPLASWPTPWTMLTYMGMAVVLLVAIVAAVALTLRRRKDTKYFSPSSAVKVKRNDRVRMVSMKAESERARAISGNGAALPVPPAE